MKVENNRNVDESTVSFGLLMFTENENLAS